ncbi:ABC transporter substrate-binding protein [Pseudomonas sp. Au-Pse12]|uniref:ABC transporter substrate-binding protein n=1 Tax=Pseudomonas sp. Au-Pse12 TaxID=2906459 RepID=UPI001E39ABFC|nr:ABC transporter substrate-binding protein [Pseudomonas sp. Au-Pse12]MCE4057957.1 ABC transporter substrate-binding protein [Pseudomonas sp. Au-Pse12]
MPRIKQHPWLAILLCLSSLTALADSYQNCGQNWNLKAPPQRIVALNQHSADLLLALDAGPSMIGIAYLDDDGRAQAEGQYHGVPVIARQYPSPEVLYSLKPDLVVGGFASAFPNNFSSRERLGAIGVGSYLLESACAGHDEDYFGHIRRDLLTLGRLLDKQARARQLIAELDADLSAAAALYQGRDIPSVFYLDSEVNGLASQGQRGFVGVLLRAAGARNSFASIDRPRLVVDSETLLANDPDVMLLADALWSPASRKRRLLHNDPVLSRLRAVREERLIDLPFTQLVPGITSGRTALELARRLHQKQRQAASD